MQCQGKSSSQERIRHASSSSRPRNGESSFTKGEIDSFQDDDIVGGYLCTLKDRVLTDSMKPSDFVLYPAVFDGKLVFVNMTPHPKIQNSVIVNDDLTFEA